MEIAYAAHTESCTFLLDAEGICRWVVAADARAGGGGTPGGQHFASGSVPAHAERCIGAQYVASLDPVSKGGLVDMPKAGAPLLFARVEPNGRITLVRTGALLRFETRPSQRASSRPPARSSDAPSRPGSMRRGQDSGVRPLPSSRSSRDTRSEDEESTTPFQPSTKVLAAARKSEHPSMHAASPDSQPTPTTPHIPPPPRMPRIPEPTATQRMDDLDDADTIPRAEARASSVPPRRSTRLPEPPRAASVPAAPETPTEPIAGKARPKEGARATAPRRPSLVRVSAPRWDAPAVGNGNGRRH